MDDEPSSEIPHELIRAFGRIHDRMVDGAPVHLEELITQFPDQAEFIREHFDTMLAVATMGDCAEESARSSTHKKVGEFTVVREIGRGGMGVVYEAVQTSMHRKVALKVLPFAALAGDRALKRFHNEVRAAAALDHPNIVAVYSFGEEQGVHYYAMQLIHGNNLAEAIRERRSSTKIPNKTQDPSVSGQIDALDVTEAIKTPHRSDGDAPSFAPDLSRRETVALGTSSTARSTGFQQLWRSAAELTRQAAMALQHAHTLGVVHRDIKPSNLMVDNRGKLWITDFGLAQIEADNGVTITGDVIGTLKYMSPEQASGDHTSVDRRTDIYSLGATLYELLTLRAPFELNNRKALLASILHDAPKAPRQHDATIPIDLETICLKCLSKDPADRYSTADDLADDLDRFLAKKPIVARPPSLLDRIQKWTQRNQTVTLLAIVSTLVLAIVSTVGFVHSNNVNRKLSAETFRAETNGRRATTALRREQQYKDEAIAAGQKATRHLYFALMRQAYADGQEGQTRRMFRTLEQFVPESGGVDYRGWEWYYLMQLCRGHDQVFRGHMNYVIDIGWHPSKPLLGSLGRDAVQIWDVATSNPTKAFRHESDMKSIAWHPDGSRFAAICGDDRLRIWEIATGKIVSTIDGVKGYLRSSLRFSPDGTMLAWKVENAHWCVLNIENEKVIWSYQGERNSDSVETFAWSPDSRLIACCGRALEVWDIYQNKLVLERKQAQDAPSVAWSQRGVIAHAGFDQRVELFDTSEGSWGEILELDESITSLAWSDDGRYLAIGTPQQICVWDQAVDRITDRLMGHTDTVLGLRWRPGEYELASCSRDMTLRTWRLKGAVQSEEPLVAGGNVVSPDGRMVASVSHEMSELVIRSTDRGEVRHRFPIDVRTSWRCLTWSEDSRVVGCNDAAGRYFLWDVEAGENTHVLAQPHHDYRAMAAFAHGHPWIAVAFTGKDNQEVSVVVYDLENGDEILNVKPDVRHTRESHGVSWSWDDRLLSIAGSDGRYRATTTIWDVASSTEIHVLPDPSNWVQPLAWHPDARHVATGGFSGVISVRDLGTQSVINILRGHTSYLQALSWSGDGRRLASKSRGALRLWDPFEGIEILEIRNKSERFRSSNAYFDGHRIRFEDPTVGDLDILESIAYVEGPEFLIDRALIDFAERDVDSVTKHLRAYLNLRPNDHFARRLLVSSIGFQVMRSIQANGDFAPLVKAFAREWLLLAEQSLANASGESYGMSEFEQLAKEIDSISNLWLPKAQTKTTKDACKELLISIEQLVSNTDRLRNRVRRKVLDSISAARAKIDTNFDAAVDSNDAVSTKRKTTSN